MCKRDLETLEWLTDWINSYFHPGLHLVYTYVFLGLVLFFLLFFSVTCFFCFFCYYVMSDVKPEQTDPQFKLDCSCFSFWFSFNVALILLQSGPGLVPLQRVITCVKWNLFIFNLIQKGKMTQYYFCKTPLDQSETPEVVCQWVFCILCLGKAYFRH